MVANPEQRENARFPHKATIMFENYTSGNYYEGRMLNYSRGGLCFESDFSPEIGAEIFIGIEKSPYSSNHDVYRARVIWNQPQSKNESLYYYDIGVKFY